MNKNTEAITSYEIFDVVRVALGKFQLLNLFQFTVNVFVADTYFTRYPAANGGYSYDYQTSAEHVSSQESFMNVMTLAMCLTIRKGYKSFEFNICQSIQVL